MRRGVSVKANRLQRTLVKVTSWYYSVDETTVPSEPLMIQEGCTGCAGRNTRQNIVQNSSQHFTLLPTSPSLHLLIFHFSFTLKLSHKRLRGTGTAISSLRPMSVTTISKADTALDIFGYLIGIIAEFLSPQNIYLHNTSPIPFHSLAF